MISPLGKKLRFHVAQRALILNAPESYWEALGEVGGEPQIDTEPTGEYDFAHLFVSNQAELEERIGPVFKILLDDAILWISYPKGSSGIETDLNRDKLRELLADKGIRPVAQVSIDQVWSAMRFRPLENVGS
jgi:hypothetical protein